MKLQDFRFAAAFVIVAILAGCGGAPVTDGEGFVTRLGNDTLAVESFRHTETGMEADVVLRTPETTLRRYVLELDDTGNLVSYTAEVRRPGEDGPPLRTEVAVPAGDSLEITVTEEGESEVHTVAAGPDALPFIDMVHWPFDEMLMRARASGSDTLTQPLFTARGAMDFTVADISADSMTVTHPFRGTMAVRVDDEGHLVHLDAGETTRKLVVDRVDQVDVEAVAARFAAQEAEGQTFGELSGRGETQAQVDGASIRVDYGQPSKRGRVIWGELVPYGELWRTGANRATHLETDTPIMLGDLEVPAGTYTLYTIPEEDGGTLIVNRQTGQGGTTYNQDRDLGRVDLQRSPLDETLEDFTIAVEDTEAGGTLSLRWDRSEFYVPFTVR